ncbi:MAG: hypothetical protein DCF32_01615 [Leptolyngbya sp.]|nr:MAG: hypothetical protein DCF32_01615 [Leptolyngbya sp.]
MRPPLRWLLLLLAVGLPLVLGWPGPVGVPLDLAQEATEASTEAEADRLYQEGRNLYNSSDFRGALRAFEQALTLYRQVGNANRESNTLTFLGLANRRLSNYPQALDHYKESLTISQRLGDRADEANTLNNIGIVNQLLGDYPEALDYYEQSLAIKRELGDRASEAKILNNIGDVNRLLGDYPEALDYYEQSLAIKRELGDRAGEANTLNNIGIVNKSLGDYPEALNNYEQSLAIKRELGDRAGEANALNNIGVMNKSLGDYPEALDYYEQSLAITRELGDRASEARILDNIGILFELQEDIVLAIVFLKQAINTYETIRQSNQALEQSLQESYTATIEGTYRRLADLLLQQDRILEAQRVLDLLRVQELDTYLRGVRGNADTQVGVALRPDEQAIADRYTANQAKLIALGRERAELAKIAPDQRTPQQQARIAELRQLEQAVLLTFQSFFEQADIVTLVNRLRNTLGAANIEMPELNGLRDNLQRLDQNAVVLYPLVLDDRLELVLVTPGQAPIRRTVPVTRVELNRAIGELRYALESPDRDAATPAQQLYDWLIRPIEADLQQAQAKTIIYSPDLRLRYVPLAALHDGDGWLIERYAVNNITAASLADLNHIPSRGNLSVLAAAFTEGRYEFQVGNRTVAYNGLIHAGPEVEALSSLIPGTVSRLNQAFTPSLIFEMDDYRIIHLATHAAFNPGSLEDSYILFGNGEKATLADVKGWSFPNVDLVVLSACETAVGDVLRAEETPAAGTPAGTINGEEILGFGYLMQLAGADAAIGSLWKVDDGGTQVLMSAFYDALREDGLATAAALQQAQLDLIRLDSTPLGESSNRGGFELAQDLGLDPNNLAHPHYWAPFILIGNGL